jgi:hypothetical protein
MCETVILVSAADILVQADAPGTHVANTRLLSMPYMSA